MMETARSSIRRVGPWPEPPRARLKALFYPQGGRR
jgi:hypothetical protein